MHSEAPKRPTDIIRFDQQALTQPAQIKELITTFVTTTEGTAALGLTIMQTPNRHKQLQIMATTLTAMADALTEKTVSETTFHRKFQALLTVDPSLDPDGNRNYSLITSVLTVWAQANDAATVAKAQMLSQAISVSAMEKLNYPDASFCSPDRMATYISNALFNLFHGSHKKQTEWQMHEQKARVDYLLCATLERDTDFDPEEPDNVDDDDDFITAVGDHLLVHNPRRQVIIEQLTKFGGEAALNLLELWGVATDEFED